MLTMYAKVKSNPILIVSALGAAAATAYELQTESATQTIVRTAGFFLYSNALIGVSAYGVKKAYDTGMFHSIANSLKAGISFVTPTVVKDNVSSASDALVNGVSRFVPEFVKRRFR